MASYRYERDITPEDLALDKPRELTKAEARANWWHYHWYYVLAVVLAVLVVGYFVWSRVTEVEPDYTVAVIGSNDPDAVFLSDLKTTLESVADDVNGDGKVTVRVKSIWLSLDFEHQDISTRQLMESSEDKLNSDFYLCESLLFLVDDPAALQQRYGCFRNKDGTDPQDGDIVNIDDFAVPLEETALSGVQDPNGALWYLARRAAEGVDEKTLTQADSLWEALQ